MAQSVFLLHPLHGCAAPIRGAHGDNVRASRLLRQTAGVAPPNFTAPGMSHALSQRFSRRESKRAHRVVMPGSSPVVDAPLNSSASRQIVVTRAIKPRERAVMGELPRPACP